MIDNILNDIKKEIENIKVIDPEFLISKGTSNGFEKLVPIVAEEVIEKYNREYKQQINLDIHYGHHFPDIDITVAEKKYGVEIKYRKNGTWTTNGNSVLESITDDNYENIYLLFGSKIPGEQRIMVRFAPYWQTTSSIKVTHSPRFFINMNNLDDSVFESEAEYNVLRQMDEESKVSYIQNYLSQNTDGVKWYTSSKNEISAIPFATLPKDTQNQIITEIMILYPDDLIIGSPRTKYNRAAQYIIDEYYAFSSSLRDLFSASGQVNIENVPFPRIIQNFINNKTMIISTLAQANNDFAIDAINGWEERKLISHEEEDLITKYKKTLDYIGQQDNELLTKINSLGYNQLSSFIFS